MDTPVEMWLDELGLGRYAKTFVENDIDTRALPYLTEADLRDLGVSLGHRKILMAAITAFRSRSGAGEGARGADLANATPSNEAERRLLSVLFCDLVGWTQLSQAVDPEEMRDLSRRYQDAVTGAVTRYGGYVAKYLGDGVLAYFGWPKAYEDQAERSVRAGLEVLMAVSAVPVPGEGHLKARVGIATGQVVVGDLIGASSREEAAIAGETPNFAARLQEAAGPGQLVVADATRRLIGTGFEIEDLGKCMLKGFPREVPVFRVVGERQVESRFEAAHGGVLGAFVGRSHELKVLLNHWEIARAGHGQVLLISGEAGIGKSRLVRELTTRISGMTHELIQLQCSPYHVNSAFHPIIERLTRAAGIMQQDPSSVRLDKLDQMLRKNGEDASAVGPVYAELLSIDAEARYGRLDVTPQQLKEQTINILVERLVLLATRSPILMVVEDAHWIDPSTHDVFDQIVARVAALPAMVLFTHRPEWSVDWDKTYDHCSQLALGRLERPQIADLACAISGKKLNQALIDAIAVRTDGVPLFIEELTRSVLERYPAQSGSIAVPLTLQASLMSRLDRLPQSAKEVAYIASVIGRDFDNQMLAKVTRLSQGALAEALAHLVRVQLVIKKDPPNPGYMFRHALIQDAAYQSLLTRIRRLYHQRVADSLVGDYPEIVETQPELVARHFSEANLPEAALPFWKRGALRALTRSANFEAVDHCEHALAAASSLSDEEVRRREILAATLTLGRALHEAGRLQEAMARSRAAAEMARELGDDERFVQAAMDYDNALFLSNEMHRDSISFLEQAMVLVGNRDDRLRCQIMSRLARMHLIVGNEKHGDDYSQKAGELARRVGDKMALLNILINVFLVPPSARLHMEVSDWRSAMDEMFNLADELDEDDARGRALSLDIYVSAEFGDRARMDEALNRLEVLGDARQRLHVQWIARHGRAMQALLEGDFAAAEQHAEAALELGRNILGDPVEGVYGIQMFTIRREQNRLAEVASIIKHFVDNNADGAAWRPGLALIACSLGYEKSAQRYFDEIAESGFAFPRDARRSTTLGYLAEVCAALQDCDRAESLYELLKSYDNMTITAGVTTVCYGSAGRYLGQLATVLGDWDRAEEHFEKAMEVNQKMHAWPWLAWTRYDYSRMLRQRGRYNDAENADKLLEITLDSAARLNMVALTKAIVGRTH